MRHALTAALAMLAGLAHAVGPAPQPVTVDSQSSVVAAQSVYRGSARTFRIAFKDGGTATSLSGLGATPAFMCWATSATATVIYTGACTVVSAAAGTVDVAFASSQLDYTPGRYIYELGTTGDPLVYRQGVFTILASPFGSGASQAFGGTNINWGTIVTQTGVATYGPHSAGTGIVFGAAAADGSVAINVTAQSGATSTNNPVQRLAWTNATVSGGLTLANNGHVPALGTTGLLGRTEAGTLFVETEADPLALLVDGSRSMAGMIDMNGNVIDDCAAYYLGTSAWFLAFDETAGFVLDNGTERTVLHSGNITAIPHNTTTNGAAWNGTQLDVYSKTNFTDLAHPPTTLAQGAHGGTGQLASVFYPLNGNPATYATVAQVNAATAGIVTVESDPIFTDWAYPAGYGLDFPGWTQTLVRVQDNDLLDPGADAFTACAWLKTAATYADYPFYCMIFDHYAGNVFWSFGLGNYPSGNQGKPCIQMRDAALNMDELVAGVTVNDGYWHHLAVTRSSDGKTNTIYVDGVAVTNSWGANTAGLIDPANQLDLGDTYTDGTIDEMAIWQRELTATEIAELYDSGTGQYISPTGTFFSTSVSMSNGLSAVWHFDEGYGLTTQDGSSNNLDGTLVSMEQDNWVGGKVGEQFNAFLTIAGANASANLAPDPDDGEVLSTDGTTNKWVAAANISHAHTRSNDVTFAIYPTNTTYTILPLWTSAGRTRTLQRLTVYTTAGTGAVEICEQATNVTVTGAAVTNCQFGALGTVEDSLTSFDDASIAGTSRLWIRAKWYGTDTKQINGSIIYTEQQ